MMLLILFVKHPLESMVSYSGICDKGMTQKFFVAISMLGIPIWPLNDYKEEVKKVGKDYPIC